MVEGRKAHADQSFYTSRPLNQFVPTTPVWVEDSVCASSDQM